MDKFIRRQNVDRYVGLLASEPDPEQRQRIMKLLSEERQKQKDAGDSADD
jgi:hypothetical protein